VGAHTPAADGPSTPITTPITLTPSGPPPAPKRSRLPAIAGAALAAALGAGVVLWTARSGDDDSSASTDTGSPEATDDSGAADPADSIVETTVAPVAPVAPVTTESVPPATTAPPTLPDTITPETTPAPETTTAPTPANVVDVPPGAVLYADPAGWSISVDPAWQQSPDAAAWFTGTGSGEFQDNVNVAVEDLASPRTLDDYVAAAIALINTQATDFEIVDQRRVVGTDGVEVEVIEWTGSFAGLPRLAFVQAVTVTPQRAYIATFTSQPDRMPALAPTVTPVLTTIRGT